MAVGKKSRSAEPTEAESTSRVASTAGWHPPPEGGLWVRDPEAARALAVKKQVAVFELAGQEVPEHLAALAADLPEDLEEDSDIDLVDAVSGQLFAEVEVSDVDAGRDFPEGAARAWQTAPRP